MLTALSVSRKTLTETHEESQAKGLDVLILVTRKEASFNET